MCFLSFFYTQDVLLSSFFFPFLLVVYLFIYVPTSLFYVLQERVRLEEEDEAALPMMGSHWDSLANLHALTLFSVTIYIFHKCQNTRGGLLPIDLWLRLGFIANIFFSYSYLSVWQVVIVTTQINKVAMVGKYSFGTNI